MSKIRGETDIDKRFAHYFAHSRLVRLAEFAVMVAFVILIKLLIVYCLINALTMAVKSWLLLIMPMDQDREK